MIGTTLRSMMAMPTQISALMRPDSDEKGTIEDIMKIDSRQRSGTRGLPGQGDGRHHGEVQKVQNIGVDDLVPMPQEPFRLALFGQQVR